MPSQFHNQFRDLGFPGLLAEFGEPIRYFLVKGGERSINAIVDRSPPATYDAAGNVVLFEFAVRIYNHPKMGVLASEVNTGGDEVELIDELGNSKPVRKSVMMRLREDSGVIELACR